MSSKYILATGIALALSFSGCHRSTPVQTAKQGNKGKQASADKTAAADVAAFPQDPNTLPEDDATKPGWAFVRKPSVNNKLWFCYIYTDNNALTSSCVELQPDSPDSKLQGLARAKGDVTLGLDGYEIKRLNPAGRTKLELPDKPQWFEGADSDNPNKKAIKHESTSHP